MGRITRRRLLGMAGAAGTLAVLESSAAFAAPRSQRSMRRPAANALPSRIAFGSCANQEVHQPIWDAVLESEPELFIFLGDNIYGDTRDPAVLRAKYEQLGRQRGFRRLCERTPVLATWDDHDFGEDDAGGDYPMKEASRQLFCDFWGEAEQSPRRTRDGIYDSVLLEADGRRMQILLPDLRFNRTALRRRESAADSHRSRQQSLQFDSQAIPGPYERNPDPTATMLGEPQWRWLERQLAQPADIRVFASSVQVVADFPGWEGWINFAADHQRLLQTIRRQKANGLVCISGDMHFAEISRLELNAPYPIWDFTSSGLTEVFTQPTPNALRVGKVLAEPNFGLLTLNWQSRAAPSLRFEARDVQGRTRLMQEVNTAELVTSPL